MDAEGKKPLQALDGPFFNFSGTLYTSDRYTFIAISLAAQIITSPYPSKVVAQMRSEKLYQEGFYLGEEAQEAAYNLTYRTILQIILHIGAKACPTQHGEDLILSVLTLAHTRLMEVIFIATTKRSFWPTFIETARKDKYFCPNSLFILLIFLTRFGRTDVLLGLLECVWRLSHDQRKNPR